MKILLWHGYLMSGSGSNIYTYNVAAAWRRQGHDVMVMCQEIHAAKLPIVDRDGSFTEDNLSLEVTATGASAESGTCTVVRPFIHGLLPVYVYDDYEGFEVKRFVDLDEDELDRYTDDNVTAMRIALESFDPDVVVTGHEVMGPYIAKLACEATGHTYVAKLHGSALEYAVKEQERYVRYARAGLDAAHRVVGGSGYMLREAASVLPGLEGTVVNPGVDTRLFRPIAQRSETPTVGYVGKLIAAKGVHDLLAALGATTTPDLEAVIVGYGGDEDDLVALQQALAGGDMDRAQRIADGLAFSASTTEFLSTVDDGYLARASAVPVRFPGRLDHEPLARVLPTFHVLVVPSVVPEAFGMVAAEAAACGVLPLVPDHSGISEAGAAVEEAIGAPGFLTFDHTDPVRGIAAGIDRIMSMDPDEFLAASAAAAAHAHDVWSWEHVAESLVQAAR